TPTVRQFLLIIKRIVIVIGIAVAFSLGLMGAIYLSLRSSQTRVPDVVGKDRAAAETTIEDAGLNFRVRATRATAEAKPDTVLIQLPAAGVTVKVGQTVAVDISRATNGETTTLSSTNENTSTENKNQNTNSISASPSPTPKKKPANRNANDNANAANRNFNANRVPTNLNGNANRTTTPVNANTNSENANRPPRNANANRRPVPAPTP
ncbi:MAG TPA: PASTA domain-containing protein, partial [Pyrinomonadaceae bacterium]